MAKLYCIGNAHIDPVWLWRWQEGYAEIKATFRSALDRIAEFEDFVFTCSSAAYYAWVEENEPAMFEEIRQRVNEGRWVIVGGYWIQPDCNLPCGESFARQGLYSQRYYLAKFGRMSRVGYNPDSFGHNGNLPQLLKNSGMDSYVFMRPGEHEKTAPDLFAWEGIDGTRIPAYRIMFGYGTPGPLNDLEVFKSKVAEVDKKRRETGLDQMLFYGVGNHGGGPTVRTIECLEGMMNAAEPGPMAFGSPDDFFDAVRSSGFELPVVKGDLQHHASGCYSAMSEIKELNRRAELRLLGAEKFSTIASVLFHLPFHTARIGEAWKKVLFNQFHDIMGGCCIPEAYEDVKESFGFALHEAAEIANAGMQKISWHIDTSKGLERNDGKDEWISWEKSGLGQPFVAFNPLSWSVRAPIRINRALAAVADDKGKPLAIQRVRASRTNGEDKWDTAFIGEVPAMGYRVFWAYGQKGTGTPETGMVSVSEGVLENEFLKIAIDSRTGGIRSLYDKRSGLPLIGAGGSAAQVIDESDSDTWAHGIFAFDRIVGSFSLDKIEVVESGPVRAVLRVSSSWGGSRLSLDYILYAGIANLRIEVDTEWTEKHKMLKIAFPVSVGLPEVTYEIPYGFIRKEPDGREEPAGKWADLSGTTSDGRKAGLAVLNSSKYGYDAKGSTLRITALRSPLYSDHFGVRDGQGRYMDQGEQRFSLVLVPHSGDWTGGDPVRRAYELNASPQVVVETYHTGRLPETMSGVSLDVPNVIVEVFKMGEDGDAYVLRCFETEGKPTAANISIGLIDRSFRAEFHPCEIKTFLLPCEKASPVREVDFIEREREGR